MIDARRVSKWPVPVTCDDAGFAFRDWIEDAADSGIVRQLKVEPLGVDFFGDWVQVFDLCRFPVRLEDSDGKPCGGRYAFLGLGPSGEHDRRLVVDLVRTWGRDDRHEYWHDDLGGNPTIATRIGDAVVHFGVGLPFDSVCRASLWVFTDSGESFTSDDSADWSGIERYVPREQWPSVISAGKRFEGRPRFPDPSVVEFLARQTVDHWWDEVWEVVG